MRGEVTLAVVGRAARLLLLRRVAFPSLTNTDFRLYLVKRLLSPWIGRIELQRQPQVLERLDALTLLGQQDAQEPMRVRQVGPETQGMAKRFDGPRAVTLDRQTPGQVVVAQGVIRLEPDRLAVTVSSLGVFPLKEGGIAQEKVGLGGIGRQLQGRVERLLRSRVVFLLR